MKKLFLLIVIAASLTSCSYTIPPFRHVLFIDFEDIRSYGVEVTNGNLPEGAIPLGPYVETVCYGRSSKRKGTVSESKAFPNQPEFKVQTINIGSEDSDLKQLNASLANEIKKIGGDGIAKLTVSQFYNTEYIKILGIAIPFYEIEGIIYKNK